MTGAPLRLDFAVIGSRKCATTWLYELFLRHPEVRVSALVKESGYFARHFDRGPEWYAGLFEGTGEGRITGEVDPSLITCPEAPARIHAAHPAAKIVAIFRNPADLFFSSYDHAIRKGDTTLPPARAWEELPALREELLFGSMLERILAVFPPAQVLVLFYEQIEADPRAVLTRLSAFLGIRDAYDEAQLGTRVNVARSARSPLAAKLLSRAARVARRAGLHALVQGAKRLPLLTAVYRPKDREAVAAEREGALRGRILGALREELIRFGRLAKVDPAREWPEAAPYLATR